MTETTPIESDCRYYAHLPYFVDKFIGPGWAQVGDAGGFLDPFYSPGLDQMSFSVWTRTRMILKELGGATAAEMEKEYSDHNKRYDRYFKYFYDSIYKDKYYVMGDYDTMTTAFLLDTALYYFAMIMPLYRWSHDRLGVPPFLSLLVEVSQRAPSAVLVTLRRRPQRPEKTAWGVPTPVPAELIWVTQSWAPVTPAM